MRLMNVAMGLTRNFFDEGTWSRRQSGRAPLVREETQRAAVRAEDFLPEGAEWGTFALIVTCHLLWGLAVFVVPQVSMACAVGLATILITLHSSLCHEVIHGHPFRNQRLNEVLVLLPLNLAIPYGRFRDTHLAHHNDDRLTDPYDDPESNFQDPAVWAQMPLWRRLIMRANNTLFGRMVIGPVLGLVCFVIGDAKLVRAGETGVMRDWLLHCVGVVLVVALVLLSPLTIWAYLLGAYGALSLLKVRTFLEHQAHDDIHGRTAIVEGQGVFAFLFLNNNLHIVHHLHPGVPWQRLPALYRAGKAGYHQANHGYVLPSYGAVFARYFLRAKDPVPHPLWQPGE